MEQQLTRRRESMLAWLEGADAEPVDLLSRVQEWQRRLDD
jgi:hypothetical protein